MSLSAAARSIGLQTRTAGHGYESCVRQAGPRRVKRMRTRYIKAGIKVSGSVCEAWRETRLHSTGMVPVSIKKSG